MLRTTAAQENYIDLDAADPPDETGSDDEFPGYVGELPDSQPLFDAQMALPVDTLCYEERDGVPVASREEELQARIENLKQVIEVDDVEGGGETNIPLKEHEEPSPVSKRVADLESRIALLKKLRDTPVPPESKTFPV